MQSKGKKLKALLHAPEITILPGVYDGYSARLAEASGFVAASISGAGVSEARLGWADRGIMSFRDNLEACRHIADCSGLLLQADADTGYGNAVNVHFTVQAFEAAGVAAIMIEDQVWPKRCGHMAGKQVIPAQEMADKIRAAVDARRDPDFVIRARTDAAGPLGIQAAIDRLCLYAEAGADAVFADALLSAEDIEAVARAVPRPLNVNMGLGIRSRPTTPLIHPRRLQAMGVASVSYPRLLSASAVRGMTNAISALKTMLDGDEPTDRPDLLVSFDEINTLTGFEFLEELERRYVDGTARAAE